MFAVLLDESFNELRVFYRRGTDNNALHAAGQIHLRRLGSAYAAADLDFQTRVLCNVKEYLFIRLRGVLCAVKIDHMYPLCAAALEHSCSVHIAVRDLVSRAVVALHEPDAAAVFYIDRR